MSLHFWSPYEIRFCGVSKINQCFNIKFKLYLIIFNNIVQLQMYSGTFRNLPNSSWKHLQLYKIIFGLLSVGEYMHTVAACQCEPVNNIYHPQILPHIRPLQSTVCNISKTSSQAKRQRLSLLLTFFTFVIFFIPANFIISIGILTHQGHISKVNANNWWVTQ